MEQLNNIDNEAFLRVLANPADAQFAYSLNLNALVNQYPQSGILRALLAAGGDDYYIKHAAVHFDATALYKVVNAPGTLAAVTAEQIVAAKSSVTQSGEIAGMLPSDFEPGLPIATDSHLPSEELLMSETENPVEEISTTDYFEPAALAEEPLLIEESSADEVKEKSGADHVPSTEAEPADSYKAEEITHYTAADKAGIQQDLAGLEVELNEPEVLAPVQEASPVAEEELPVEKPAEQVGEPIEADQAAEQEQAGPPSINEETEAVTPEPVQDVAERPLFFHQPIEDEVYDEIVSIEDINLEQLAFYNAEMQEAAAAEEPASVIAKDHFVFEPITEQEEELTVAPEEAERHFVFEPIEIQHPEEEKIDIAEPLVAAETQKDEISEKHHVSKYHDDKLPYTFMWWLDKTRREHDTQYQPYTNPAPYINTHTGIKPRKKKQEVDELQQQYVENIFNENAIDELQRNNTLKAEDHPLLRKEDIIINRFIETEPHIKNTGDLKLDNENKAKKSSEDADEFVTETLARIYTEQMLYQKAISTYKNLMLKFPEKSLYFASQIEQLQKKPN